MPTVLPHFFSLFCTYRHFGLTELSIRGLYGIRFVQRAREISMDAAVWHFPVSPVQMNEIKRGQTERQGDGGWDGWKKEKRDGKRKMLKKKAGGSERSFPGVFCEDSRDQERVAAMMGSRGSKTGWETRTNGEKKRGEEKSIGVWDELHAAPQELDGSVICFKSDVASRTEGSGLRDYMRQSHTHTYTHRMEGWLQAGVKYRLKSEGQEGILFHWVKYITHKIQTSHHHESRQEEQKTGDDFFSCNRLKKI